MNLPQAWFAFSRAWRDVPLVFALSLLLTACASNAPPPAASSMVASSVPPSSAAVTPTLPGSASLVAPVIVPPVVAVQRTPRIALALGGGAARGFAHIGVIKALEARGISPDIIVGTSAGALVGALYAAGYNGIELNRLALSMDETVLSDWTLSTRGLLKGDGLQNYVNQAVKNRPIEQLTRKFAATATDFQTGQLVVFERGNTGRAVRASASIPGIFQPTEINGHEYVDGGLVAPVPIRIARNLGADIVIAVDISARPAGSDTAGYLSELLQTFSIMGQTIASFEEKEADVVLRPALPRVSGSDFAARNASVLAGEEAVSLQADQIKAVIAAKQRALSAQ